MRNCKQVNCIFLKSKQGCRKCGDCSASPFIVAGDCLRCDECENIPNSCRWDDDMPSTKQDEKQPKKEEEQQPQQQIIEIKN